MQAIAAAQNGTPGFVFSGTLERAQWGDWDEARVVRGGAADGVRKLKAEPGESMVVWASVTERRQSERS